jgi:hypothetical protein
VKELRDNKQNNISDVQQHGKTSPKMTSVTALPTYWLPVPVALVSL